MLDPCAEIHHWIQLGVAGASPISFLESMTWTGLAWASPILS